MSRRLRVAIVGCGGIGNSHARAYLDTGRVDLVGVADVITERAEGYAAAYDSVAFTSADELLAATEPDLVSICTPPDAHAVIAEQVLAAGSSVVIEKPPVLSLAEFDRVAAADRDSDGNAYVIFQHRHGSGAVRAHRLLREGVLGQPMVAVCETLWFRPRSYFDPDWRGTWTGEGGGPTLGHGIHQLDLLLHLLGPWKTINAMAVRLDRPVEFEDVSIASVIFENGAVGSIINSLLSPRELSRIRIDTTGGTLEVDHVYGHADADWSFFPAPDAATAGHLGRDPQRADDDHENDDHRIDPWAAAVGQDVPSDHRAQLAQLVDDLAAGRGHATTLASTRPTVELVTGLYASAITGAPVGRADLVPGHRFYDALNGGIDQTEIDAVMTP